MTQMPINQSQELADAVLDAVDQVVVGKRPVLKLVLAGVLAGGHVLLEDMPGLAKTLAARSLAQALGLEFKRAQFTPDLLPADLTGSFIYDQSTSQFVFRPGPVFSGLLLADEINRTPPKTQAALLEAMQEKQVSVEGETFQLARPFHVLATANPIEHEGTYPLPEAQLDRFLLRLSFEYPTPEEEWEVLQRRIGRMSDDITVERVLADGELAAMQRTCEEVHIDEAVGTYAVNLVHATRSHPSALVGASPRGSLALLTCSRALALLNGRDHVLPEDIKELAQPALAHRITVRPELWLKAISGADVVADVLGKVAAPDHLA